MKLKIKNKKKFIIRIVELLIVVLTIILTILSIKLANQIRGYATVGGEYLLPIIPSIVIVILEDYLEKSERKERNED